MKKIELKIDRHCDFLIFPLIAIFTDCIIIYRSVDEMRLNSLHSFNINYFHDALIFCKNNDKSQSVYKIAKTTQEKSISNTILKMIFACRLTFTLEDVTDLYDFSYIKLYILNDIKKDELWEERGDFPVLATEVGKCNNMAELLGVLA